MQGIRRSYMVLALLACCRKAAERCDRLIMSLSKAGVMGARNGDTRPAACPSHSGTCPGKHIAWLGRQPSVLCNVAQPVPLNTKTKKVIHCPHYMCWVRRLAPRRSLHASLCRTAAATDATQPQSSETGSRGSLFQPPAYGGHELGILCGGSPRLVPPMQQCVLILMNSPMAWVAFSVCCASSRVGDRIRTWGLYKA